MAQINDFGRKIGGARKDTWKREGLKVADIYEMTAAEKEKYIKRDYIWPKPDMKDQMEKGMPRFICFWKNEMRKVVRPSYNGNLSAEEYIETVRKIKVIVEELETEDDIADFSRKAANGLFLKKIGYRYHYVDSYQDIINGNNLLKTINLSKVRKKMEKENFGLNAVQVMEKEFPIFHMDDHFHLYQDINGRLAILRRTSQGDYFYYPRTSDIKLKDINGKYMVVQSHSILCLSEERKECEQIQEEAFAAKLKQKADKRADKKKKWIPVQFEHLEMSSSAKRYGHISGNYLMEVFGIPGGEFGNWTNDKERQISLDYTYDSFYDIAEALDINPKCISLPGLSRGGLSIAFGARGRGNAVAHYEPLLEVINITKIRGAGSLGHEWGHALDHFIGQSNGCPMFATEPHGHGDIPKSLVQVMDVIYYDEYGKHTSYYKDSISFDRHYEKAGHGYWASACELFARAFACYLTDKLAEKGYRNDYLCGHSDTYVFKDSSGNPIYAFPRGEERKRINQAISELIEDLKETGLLQKAEEKTEDSGIQYNYSADGQMCFA